MAQRRHVRKMDRLVAGMRPFVYMRLLGRNQNPSWDFPTNYILEFAYYLNQ
ncbi:MAG: hypothetical protein ACLQU2_08875 [Candidatus Binataceae bacterium]